jgi:hypothetical protein
VVEALCHEGLGLWVGGRRSVGGQLAVGREAILAQALAVETDT